MGASSRARALALVASAIAAACDVSRPVRPADTVCPQLPAALTVATDCELGPATVAVVQRGCDLTLTVSGTEQVRLTGALDGEGRLTLEPDPRVCAEIAPRTEALRSVRCERMGAPCFYDLQVPAEPRPLMIERAAPVVASFAVPARVAMRGEPPLDHVHPRSGYLTGAVVLGDAAWVATASGAFSALDCDGDEPSEVVRVDGRGDALVLGLRRAAPDCLVELARDPLDPAGFLGVSGGPQVRIHRFDAEGRVLASVDAPRLVSRTPDEEVVVIGLVAGASSETVALVLSTRDKQHESWMITLRSDTLATVRVSDPGPTPVRAATPVLRGRVFAADHTTGAILPFHAADQGFDPAFTLDVVGGPSDDAGFIGVHPPTGTLIVSTTGLASVLYFADERTSPFVSGFARFYEHAATPWASAPWPPEEGQMVVALTEPRPPYTAYLARLVVDERRFLPGATPLGRGVVRSIEVDARGRLWALLPWAGEILRVTPSDL